MPDTRSKLDHALEAARRGFKVFPVIPNGKSPLIAGWQALATRDESTIRQWWTDAPESNIGIPTSDFLVIDVDKGKGGIESFRELSLIEDFPKTLTSQTQSGGAHVIYRLPPNLRVRGGVDVLGKGIDVRSAGGLIVAPGSTIDGRPYIWRNERAPDLAPDWLIERCRKSRDRSSSAGQRVVDEDDEAVQLAWNYIRERAPTAAWGHIDDTAFKVAAKLFDFGVSIETALELMTEWSETMCSPPMQPERLRTVTQSAARNRDKAIGAAHPSASGFEAVEIDPQKLEKSHLKDSPAKPKFFALSFDESAGRGVTAVGDPLIKGLLHRQTMSVLVGAPNSGKTFLCMDMAFHIASGADWAGHKVRQGAVVYLAAEAGSTIHARVTALKQHYSPAGPVPFYVVPCPADFAHGEADVEALAGLVASIEAAGGCKVELVVVDTLNRVLAGGDENSPKDMGAVIRSADRLKELTRAHVMIVHHPGKDETKGGRGHSSLFGGTDTELVISNHTLRHTKQRDMPFGRDVGFKLRPVAIGATAEGEAVTSCYVEICEPGAAVERLPLTAQEIEWMDLIDAAVEDQPDKKRGFDVRFMQEICRSLRGQSDSSNASSLVIPRMTVTTWLTTLTNKGWLKKHKRGQWVRVNDENDENDETPAGDK